MQQMLIFIEYIRPILEALYFLASICLVATIIIGLIQLNLMKNDLKTKNKRAAIEKSLEYLNLFSTKFIPEISNYRDNFRQEVKKPVNTKKLFDGKFLLHMKELDKGVIAECLVKEKMGASDILNQLEFFSTAMLNGVADEDLVFTPVAKPFCRFIEEEHILISIMRSQGAPFKNLIELYGKWKKRLEVEDAQLQKLEAEQKINQAGNGYKAKPPIGF